MPILRFRSERAKTATIIGLAFFIVPLILVAVVVGLGGGFVIAILMIYAQWLVWLPPSIGVLFLARAAVDEVRARRKNYQ